MIYRQTYLVYSLFGSLPPMVNLIKETNLMSDDTSRIIDLIRNTEKQNTSIDAQNKELEMIITELEEYKRMLVETIKEKLKAEDYPEFIKILLKKK